MTYRLISYRCGLNKNCGTPFELTVFRSCKLDASGRCRKGEWLLKHLPILICQFKLILYLCGGFFTNFTSKDAGTFTVTVNKYQKKIFFLANLWIFLKSHVQVTNTDVKKRHFAHPTYVRTHFWKTGRKPALLLLLRTHTGCP